MIRRGWWKLALGVLVVLVIAVWDIGAPGHTGQATSTATSATPTAPESPTASPAVPGVVQPAGTPEFSTVFTGSSLDTAVWDTCYPWLQQSGCQNFGNSKEPEWYQPSQVQVSGGVLHLTAEPKVTQGTTSTGTPKVYHCRSGMVTSFPGFKFKYGYVQVVADIPAGNGLWPALWLASANFAVRPEIDILEAWGGPHFYASSYFHYSTPAGPKYSSGVIIPASSASGWHTFSLSWTKTQVTWMLDGRVIMTSTQHVPHQRMYFLADLADEIVSGRTSASAQCSGSLLIRSVKVWQA